MHAQVKEHLLAVYRLGLADWLPRKVITAVGKGRANCCLKTICGF